MADSTNIRLDRIMDEVYKDFYGTYPPNSPTFGGSSHESADTNTGSAGAIEGDTPKTQAATSGPGPAKKESEE